MRCKQCGSKMIFPATDHKNFSTGKAIAGAVIAGVPGAAAGFIGKDVKGYRCTTCGTFSTEPMLYPEELQIDSAVKEMRKNGASVAYEKFCQRYVGIEQVAGKVTAATAAAGDSYKTYNDEDDADKTEAQDMAIKKTEYPSTYVQSCPVLIDSITIKAGPDGDHLALCARNVSGKTLRSAYFAITVFDDAGDQINQHSFVYQGLAVAPGQYLPAEKLLALHTEIAFTATARCDKAVFEDGAVWRHDDSLPLLPVLEMQPLTTHDIPLLPYLRKLLAQKGCSCTNNNLYAPKFEESFRVCICGTPVMAGEICPVCGLDETTLFSCLDPEVLSACRSTTIHQIAQDNANKFQALYAQAQQFKYEQALALQKKGMETDYSAAAKIFASINGYQDAADRALQCRNQAEELHNQSIYHKGKSLLNRTARTREDLLSAIAQFEQISGWQDANEQLAKCRDAIAAMDKAEKEKQQQAALNAARAKKRKTAIIMLIIALIIAVPVSIITINSIRNSKAYDQGMAYYAAGNYEEAYEIFTKLGVYKNSADHARAAKEKIQEKQYAYVTNHRNPTDLTTYSYLKELTADGYRDSESIYKELYAVKLRIIANHTPNDTQTDISTTNGGNIFFHVFLEGGTPDTHGTETVYLDLLTNDSYKNSSVIEIEYGKSQYIELRPGTRCTWTTLTATCYDHHSNTSYDKITEHKKVTVKK